MENDLCGFDDVSSVFKLYNKLRESTKDQLVKDYSLKGSWGRDKTKDQAVFAILEKMRKNFIEYNCSDVQKRALDVYRVAEDIIKSNVIFMLMKESVKKKIFEKILDGCCSLLTESDYFVEEVKGQLLDFNDEMAIMYTKPVSNIIDNYKKQLAHSAK